MFGKHGKILLLESLQILLKSNHNTQLVTFLGAIPWHGRCLLPPADIKDILVVSIPRIVVWIPHLFEPSRF